MLTCLSSYARTYQPESYHIAQELQKYNIPDYRPRQEQYVTLLANPLGRSLTTHASRFQKAIRKVRAVQRMRRNRGFAFSQTETAGGQDQARLIRAYDTSQTHNRPSGY
jgi:phospholipid-transporting ATPase